jgi:hypothetical protein
MPAKLKETVSSTYWKYDHKKPGINFNTWNFNFLASPLSVLGTNIIQWKPFIMITLGPALFDNNNRLITLSGGYKNLHDLTQFIVTTFYMYKKQQNVFKKCM